jgi:putative NADH-flavin reductase
MPMIVVGADTDVGMAIVAAATGRGGEIRAFVSDEATAAELRGRAVKVALGDLSDASHVGGAAIGCFSAVLVAAATGDGRTMAFGSEPDEVVRSWVEAVADSGATRAILVGPPDLAAAHAALGALPESGAIDPSGRPAGEIAREVLELDDARRL